MCQVPYAEKSYDKYIMLYFRTQENYSSFLKIYVMYGTPSVEKVLHSSFEISSKLFSI